MKLHAALVVVTVLLVGPAMSQEPTTVAASWNQVDVAVKVLRNGLSSGNRGAMAEALIQLSAAVSTICSVEATKSTETPPPKISQQPTDSRIEGDARVRERERRERLTAETHRPAGPPYTGATSSEQERKGETNSCRQAYDALGTLLTTADITDNSVSRLESALAKLRQSSSK